MPTYYEELTKMLSDFSETELKTIVQKAKDWALMHGIGMRSKKNFDSDSLTTAPFTLLPSPISFEQFHNALSVQKILNCLMHKVAHDDEFLCEALKDTVKYDDFTRRLFEIYTAVRDKGFEQTISLGLFRSDYMTNQENILKQVEFNTIASSMSSFGQRLMETHRYVLNEIDKKEYTEGLPENPALYTLCDGLTTALTFFKKNNPAILFVVEDVTYNICDQKYMEFQIRSQCNSVKILRKSLAEVTAEAKLSAEKDLIVGEDMIGLVYYRSGYDPSQYREEDWPTRLLIESSTAIKCPSIQYHLAGTKKIQQVLTQKNVLERFNLTKQEIAKVREMFVPIYPLDMSPEGEEAYRLALTEPENWVMKPQREGGGNNVYGSDIPEALQRMTREEATGWILMGLIQPRPTRNCIVRPGGEIQLCDIVSELGIYGVLIGSKDEIILEKSGGHMVRSKLATAKEGGVAAGLGALDSPYLVRQSHS